jgi:hypothetical protein
MEEEFKEEFNYQNLNQSDDRQVESNDISTVPYPWRRFFARYLDITIYGTIWLLFANLLLHWNPERNLLLRILESYTTMAIMIIIEPLLLSTCGTTPGKWIFGLVVSTKDGSKLSYHQAFLRTVGVFCKGFGYNIPFYNLIREYYSYKDCKQLTPLPWEEGYSYRIKDNKGYRIIIFSAAMVLNVLLGSLILMQAQLPIHRGELTAEQYYDNCNHVISYQHLNLGKHFSSEGLWVDNTEPAAGVFEISVMGYQPYPSHELTITNGYVTGVKIESEVQGDDLVTGNVVQKYIAVTSFLAAQKEMNAIRFNRSRNIKKILKNDFDNYTFVESGIRVTNQVEYSGYSKSSDANGSILFPAEGQKNYYHMIFTMELID